MPFEKELEELRRRKEKVLQMGGPEKVKRQHEKGKLTARERIARLLDPDTFFEVGMLNTSDMREWKTKPPQTARWGASARSTEGTVAIVANDFTVLAATSSRVAGHKEGEIKGISRSKRVSLIYLGEAGGARMPDIMGSRGMGSFGGGGFDTYLQIMSRVRKTPMITAIMGDVTACPPGWPACRILWSR